MKKKTIILGIESSCDETAVAIIEENDKGQPSILSNIVSSQVDVHKEFGGVVPELAARSHIEKIDLIAKKAIANFKIREGMPLGVSVTLRNKIMYEFLDRLINIAIPRIRDFRGLNPKSFDGNGNYTLGIKEQIIFPEINYDKIDKIRGLNITICTSARNNVEALELLKNFNMPFPTSDTN